MEDYKGYFISGSAVPTYMTGRKSKSLGIVLKSGRLGSQDGTSDIHSAVAFSDSMSVFR